MVNPNFFLKQLTEADKRFFANCKSLRNFLLQVIKERKASTPKEDDADVDMISILIEDPTYKDQVEDIVDDVIVMFIAGSKTLQTTTTNLITHLLHRPDIKEKLYAEVNPILERTQEDFMKLLTTDVIEELDYLKMCYSEVLRHDSPIPQSSTSCFSKDVVIQGVTVPKGNPIFISMQEMHNNPKEWIEPFSFIPERFDSKSEYFKRPDGKPRNPLAFSPFLGGKRICLGKTFAETALKLTLPLYFHHFDFEFVDEE